MTFNISGGTNTIHVTIPEQQELNLESKETCTFRAAPKILNILQARSEQSGVSRSKLIESILIKYLRIEPKLKEMYSTLDDIIA